MRVSYATHGLSPKAKPVSPPVKPRRNYRSFGLLLKSTVNMADGFCMLDQVAGPGRWHVAALGTPKLDVSLWGWSLFAVASVLVGSLSDRLTGVRKPGSGPGLRRLSFISGMAGLLVGGLLRLGF